MDVAGIVTSAVILLVWILGIIVGVLYAKAKESSYGTLRVDTSDPDGPYIFLELNVPVSEVMSKKRVVLDVNTENYISQK